MYKINFIYKPIEHHSSHSGYDKLVYYLNGNVAKDSFLSKLFSLTPDKFTRLAVNASGMSWYNEACFLSELKTSARLFSPRNEILHYLYGEDAYCYLGFLPRIKNKKIVATYHQPPAFFKKYVQRKNHIHKLDAIITISSTQIKFFENFIGRERVFFVPHGIDTDFFVPAPKKRNEFHSCLFVGQWLRDFDTLNKVIKIINLKNENIKFNIVTSPEMASYFAGLANTKVYTNLPENELLSLYQNASLLVMPILDCTANNSILEALSCGLPIIATDVGGMKDYVDETCAILVQSKDAYGMADKILGLLEDNPTREKMGNNARKKALDFSWPLIAKRLEKVYSQLFF